ncbi:hypothetical protein FEM48_Zijuj11G0014200 [Ziziphus jujuba var. spinosa]|uniref:Uncharacterized protein n=1 Tax=Ziziphus jujuba var. spinosa TaxID=714518 RepID=A0A978UG16_ZIZJJ|nr:hypothetical protein FEM48_Zijuj11G0014200 [Ziziphus jujuba var. spinosa]
MVASGNCILTLIFNLQMDLFRSEHRSPAHRHMLHVHWRSTLATALSFAPFSDGYEIYSLLSSSHWQWRLSMNFNSRRLFSRFTQQQDQEQ